MEEIESLLLERKYLLQLMYSRLLAISGFLSYQIEAHHVRSPKIDSLNAAVIVPLY